MLRKRTLAAAGAAVVVSWLAFLATRAPESEAASRDEVARDVREDGADLHKTAVESRPRARRRTAEQDGVLEGIDHEALKSAVAAAYVELSDEERDILKRYGVRELHRAVREAEVAYEQATPADKAEADRKYLLTLNLAAKVAPLPPEPSAEQRTRQQAYVELIEAEKSRVGNLPPAEQAAHLEAFKDEHFAEDLDTQAEDYQSKTIETLN